MSKILATVYMEPAARSGEWTMKVCEGEPDFRALQVAHMAFTIDERLQTEAVKCRDDAVSMEGVASVLARSTSETSCAAAVARSCSLSSTTRTVSDPPEDDVAAVRGAAYSMTPAAVERGR